LIPGKLRVNSRSGRAREESIECCSFCEKRIYRALAKGLTYDFNYVLALDIADLERYQSPVTQRCLQPSARVLGLARHSHPSHHQQQLYELPFAKGQPLVTDAGPYSTASSADGI
jgi:hypothetical protein